jgi:glycosyltransferase involved in cell wall biosynthesis
MNIHLENVNLSSTSGPNHFASKLVKYASKSGVNFDHNAEPDVRLCFIETRAENPKNTPLYQRLDGIYFNLSQPYKIQNANIERTYNNSTGVVFQSNFNKRLTTEYFGEHPNSVVIHNGADLEFIENAPTLNHPLLDKFDNVWSCASSWRPHKRLNENIRYFLEHSSEKDCLVIAGKLEEKINKNNRIFYVGNVDITKLISLYKRSKYFLHLAWLDHCPNVVVDARASGCKVVCSSAGGTKEIAGPDAIVLEEEEWDFKPVKLYEPPRINFDKKIKNIWDIDYNMEKVAERYMEFLRGG